MDGWKIIGQLVDPREKAVLEWGAVLIGVVLVAFVVIMLVRRMLKDPAGGGQPDAGFSLSDLREMRDRGEITPEEYEQTRARVIAKVKAASEGRGPEGEEEPGKKGG